MGQAESIGGCGQSEAHEGVKDLEGYMQMSDDNFSPHWSPLLVCPRPSEQKISLKSKSKFRSRLLWCD